MKILPQVSFIIPTFNAGKNLISCLESIAKQKYIKENINVIISDGGSTDNTLQLAKKFNCEIIFNDKKLAEPGVDLGLKYSKSDLNFILAADNELEKDDWIEKMVEPFDDKEIVAAFPKQVNSLNDNWLTKYVNVFTDPFNHFVYGYAANTRTFDRVYKVKKNTPNYIVFNLNINNHPILALAQGFAVRRGFIRPERMEYDDMLPILEMIKEKKQIAYVYQAGIYHHTIKNLSHFIHKQKWAIDNALSGKNYGLSARSKYLSLNRKIKKYLWPVYAISFILPLLNSLRGLIFDREKYWAYHSFISFVSAAVFWKEFISINILRKKILLLGKP